MGRPSGHFFSVSAQQVGFLDVSNVNWGVFNDWMFFGVTETGEILGLRDEVFSHGEISQKHLPTWAPSIPIELGARSSWRDSCSCGFSPSPS